MRAVPTPLLMISVLIVACSLGAESASRVACGRCEEPDRFVRLQARSTEALLPDAASASHRAHLGPDEWTQLLKLIRVQSRPEGLLFGRTKGPVIEAFTSDEITFLSTSLTKAFAEARPEEVVVFGLAHPRTPEFTEITTGSWFIKDDALHLILANYRTAVTLPGIRSLLWEEPLRRQPGLLYELVPGEYQTLAPSKDGDTSLFGSSQPSEVAILYQSILQPDTPSKPSSVTSTRPPDGLEKRLEQLKRLWEQGLITEEEYRAKKQEFLDRL